jgi:hypothetical protein
MHSESKGNALPLKHHPKENNRCFLDPFRSSALSRSDKRPWQERYNKLFLDQSFGNIIVYSFHAAVVRRFFQQAVSRTRS